MKRFMTLLKIEGKLGFRCPDPIFFGIIMPVGIFFLIAWIAGDKQVQTGNYTFLDSVFSSILTIGICATAFMGLPTVLSDYRDKKILKHFFVTPISPKLLFISTSIIIRIDSNHFCLYHNYMCYYIFPLSNGRQYPVIHPCISCCFIQHVQYWIIDFSIIAKHKNNQCIMQYCLFSYAVSIWRKYPL